jgi:arabinofuranosyltransferase
MLGAVSTTSNSRNDSFRSRSNSDTAKAMIRPITVTSQLDTEESSGVQVADLVKLALLLLPIVIFIIGAWKYRWMSDDGFINLRVVSELRAGHGPVFNPGERVEAYTSPLWLFMLVVGDLFTPLRLEYVAVGFGISLAVVGLALVILGALRLHSDEAGGRVWFPAGALVLAVLAPMWRFASSGLETGLTFAWLGGCLVVLASWSRHSRRLPAWAAAVVGVGPLVRPEFLLLSIGFVSVVLAGQWDRDNWRTRLGLIAAGFALPFAYQIFRMGYFASLVPNPALAKEATRSYWSAGWGSFRSTFIDTYGVWIPILVLAVTAYVPLFRRYRQQAHRRAVLVIAAFVLGGAVEALYVVRVGGDWMHARLLLPALFLIVAPVAVVPMTRRFLGALLVAPWAIVAVAGLRSVDDQPRAFPGGPANAITVADFGMDAGSPQRAAFMDPGVYYINNRLPGLPSGPATAVATYGVGVPSYALGPNTYILDLFGLGDTFTSHLKLTRRADVGHEKPLPSPWIVARLLRPGAELQERDFAGPLELFHWRPIDDPRGESFTKRIADARDVLRCPRLTEFDNTYKGALGLGQFIDNLGNSFTNFGFRIPPEPRDARAELCPRHGVSQRHAPPPRTTRPSGH